MDTNFVDVPRQGLGLPRFFAVILLLFAALIGLPLVLVAIVALHSGDWRALAVIASLAPVAWMLGWLGMVLWSGRMIPRWFIVSFGLMIVAGPVVAALFSSSWLGSLAVVGMVVPTALGFLGVLRNYPGTPSKPKTFDEL